MDFTQHKIDGMPLRDAREFLRRHGTTRNIERVSTLEWRRYVDANRLSARSCRDQMPIHFAKTLGTLRALEANGFIVIDEDNQRFTMTDLGRRLKASSLRRYSREAAQRQLDEFCARCRDINRRAPDRLDPLSLCQIKATCFGSFVRGEQEVGDCDIFVVVRIKAGSIALREWEEYIDETEDLSIADGLRINPDVLVLKYIKRGLNIISMTNKLPPIPDAEKLELDL